MQLLGLGPHGILRGRGCRSSDIHPLRGDGEASLAGFRPTFLHRGLCALASRRCCHVASISLEASILLSRWTFSRHALCRARDPQLESLCIRSLRAFTFFGSS